MEQKTIFHFSYQLIYGYKFNEYSFPQFKFAPPEVAILERILKSWSFVNFTQSLLEKIADKQKTKRFSYILWYF